MTAIVLEAERRECSRCRLDGRAELRIGSQLVRCELADISLRGALLRTPASRVVAVEGQPCSVTIHLGAGPAVIVMQGAVAHVRDGQLGVACREVDLESLMHLRRILDLNLGEDKLVQGELAALTHRRR